MKKIFCFILILITLSLTGCSSWTLCKNAQHNLKRIEVEATCTNVGYTSIYCEDCCYAEVEEVFPAKDCYYFTDEIIIDNGYYLIEHCIWCGKVRRTYKK